MRRYGLAGLLLLVPALLGCSAGRPSAGFVNARLMDAYIPLSVGGWITPAHSAAAVTIAPNIAVTNAHNENLISPDKILARSDYDILFYRIEKSSEFRTAKPVVGEEVIAYGQGHYGGLREARGRVVAIDVAAMSLCADCRVQRVFSFDADAGPGFSGGPVVDAESGAVLGVTFGYQDGKGTGRRMYAYDMTLVIEEMHRLLDPRRP